MPQTHPSSTRLADRQRRLSHILQEQGLDAVALNPGPSLTYLTGLHFHLSERPVVFLMRPTGKPALVLPELEKGKLADPGFEVLAFPYGEDPVSWERAFRAAASAVGLSGMKVGVEPRGLRFLELRYLEAAASGVALVSGEAALTDLRLRKDAAELGAMRTAVDIAQRALQETLPSLRAGITERELASELLLQLFRAGTGAELPFAPIVSFGPNSANPHAAPSDRPLAPDEMILIDWGASADGYFSDLTRVFALGELPPALEEIAGVVEAANDAAFRVAGPGIAAGDVDRAARSVIEEAGYGDYFIHRTGHGLGLEGHEAPYIRADNRLPLEPGMAFTIEPGIYLSGQGGVRIEDDVVITDAGAERLSDLPRALQYLG